MTAAAAHSPYGRCDDDSCALYAMWALAIGFAVWRIIALFITQGELFYDEAQYVYWAQHPAFGYYSKPPMVAWLIALSQQICGAGEACARLTSPILHSGAALFTFGIARRMFPRSVSAVIAGLIYVTLPGVALSSGIISVDPALMFFWSAAFYFFVRAIDSPYRLRFWLACGVAAGLGMLSKYTMVIFGAGAFFYLLCTPYRRYILKMRGFWLAALAGFLVFLPNIFWNISNGFATLSHTKDNAALEQISWSPAEFLEFFGAQFGVAGPVFFAALLAGLCCRSRHEADESRHGALLLWQILPTFVIISAVALMSRAHGNWAAPAYIGVCIYIARFLCTPPFRAWLIAGLIINIIVGMMIQAPRLSASILGIDFGPRTRLSSGIIKDPLMRVEGGRALGAAVKRAYEEAGSDLYVLTNDRATHALLSYYTAVPHDRMRIWNPSGVADNHFSLTAPFKKAEPGAVYLLITRNADHELHHSTPEKISIGRYPERQKHYFLSVIAAPAYK